MICPYCHQDTLCLSPQRRFHDCYSCGFSELAPGVAEQLAAELRAEEDHVRYCEGIKQWLAVTQAAEEMETSGKS